MRQTIEGKVPNTERPKPFLRWAGGKQRLAASLFDFVPPKDRYNRYFEPFFGGGALFFAVQPQKAVIADINQELMNCYKHVSTKPQEVSRLVRRYVERDSRSFFYRIRNQADSRLTPLERAAVFIYLNKAAFNGIYRVNMMGVFNVPYGPSSKGPAVPSCQLLQTASRCLKRATILSADFEDTIATASSNDFVYLDPPYPPRSDTAYFAHYSAGRFGWDEQERVAKVFRKLAIRGCLVMLSNADQKKVISLYSEFRIHRLNAIRWLGSNGDRFRVRELVVTNYDPSEVPKE